MGVVVLTNASENIDDIGLHLLDPTRPIDSVRTAVVLPIATLDEYVGRYPLTPAFVIAVTREGDHLMAQATGQPAFRIWASAPDQFFLKVVDAQLSFTRGADGKVDGLVLHQTAGTSAPRGPREWRPPR